MTTMMQKKRVILIIWNKIFKERVQLQVLLLLLLITKPQLEKGDRAKKTMILGPETRCGSSWNYFITEDL